MTFLYLGEVIKSKVVKPLASLKFAVVVISAIAVIVAWGTIIEAKYLDAKIAQETVYHSWFAYFVFALFATNLIAVIVDRYPWKNHHIGFISAHIGILVLLLGSLLTRYYGVDGSLSVPIGGTSSQVMVSETDILVYTSLNGESFRKIYEAPANFWSHPVSAEKPLKIPLATKDLLITDFVPYALVDNKVMESSDANDGSALRFQISNDRFAQSNWLVSKGNRSEEISMGPARVILNMGDYKYTSGNALVLTPMDAEKVHYDVYSERLKGKINSGTAEAGAHFNLGWMNLEFRLLKYHQHGRSEIKFVPREQSSPETISALKFIYNGKEGWIGLNSTVRLFGDSEMYVVAYGNRRISLDFDVALKNFEVGRYQGTMRASSYQSVVRVPGVDKDITISMNQPLEYRGFTFYQASFQEDEMGKPVTSVFSVNYDPGRWLKYLGSILIVFGSIHLFYRRWKRARVKNG